MNTFTRTKKITAIISVFSILSYASVIAATVSGIGLYGGRIWYR